jgi:hypothetical protein
VITGDEVLRGLCYGCCGVGDECSPDDGCCLRRGEFREFVEGLRGLSEVFGEVCEGLALPVGCDGRWGA